MYSYEKLDNAFRTLKAIGIIARHNFMDCQSCGYAAMELEIDNYGEPVRGVTFYHEQDTEHAIDDGILYLSHSGNQNNDLNVAQDIVEVLKQNGLEVEWSGDLSQRIQVLVDADDFKRKFGDHFVDTDEYDD